MKCLHTLSRVAVALFALALALCLGCARPAEEAPTAEPNSASTAKPTTEPTAKPAPADGEEPARETVTIIEGTPLIWFVDTDEVAQLRSDMNEGTSEWICSGCRT